MKKLLLIVFLVSSFMSLQSCGGDDNIVPSGNNGDNNGGGNNGGGNMITANLPINIKGSNEDIVLEYGTDDRFKNIKMQTKRLCKKSNRINILSIDNQGRPMDL